MLCSKLCARDLFTRFILVCKHTQRIFCLLFKQKSYNGAFATNYGMHLGVIYHSNLHDSLKSGMFFSAATQVSAPDMISQLLYELRILLLYLLCKLLPPVLNNFKWNQQAKAVFSRKQTISIQLKGALL